MNSWHCEIVSALLTGAEVRKCWAIVRINPGREHIVGR